MSDQFKRELGFWDLVWFHVTAIVGLRWISIAANNGYSAIPLWIAAFLSFFLPQAFVLLKLSRKWPIQGGLYEWIKMALGPLHGFISGWCYFANNLTYYPTILSTAAGYATYIYFTKWQGLEQNKAYLFWFCFIWLWIILILNMIGLRIGKWVQNIGGISTWIPAGLVIVLGALYWSTHGAATPFQPAALLPSLSFDTLTFWSYICFAFAGFELITLLGGEIKNPETNIPRSIIFAGVSATIIYILGTIALIVSLPHEKISMISGVLQAIAEQGRTFGIPLISNVLAVLLILGIFGALGAWLSGSGRVLYSIGVDRYLPSAVSKVHPKWSTPYISILIQGVLSSLFLILSAAGATAEQFWRFLLSATVIIYFIPYLYLFAAYYWFMRKGEMPWSVAGVLSCFLGFLATAISIVISAYPPSGEGQALYIVKIVGGTIVMLVVPILLYYRAHRKSALVK
jgi:glutamate:GABA antiporter